MPLSHRVALRIYGSLLTYDPLVPANSWPHIPHNREHTYPEVVTEANVITIHVPLTPQTRGLISYHEMQAMKRTAILIDAVRGATI
jgi:phosphoglycerate dehydrogenase-like enzyme